MIIIKAILRGLFVSQLPIRTDVVVPLYRERPTLARLASELAPVLADLPAATVLLVDDGSGDGTREFSEQLIADGAFGSRAQLLCHRRNLGLAAALRTAFLAGSGELVCWLDADLSYDPRILVSLVDEVVAGADVALASAYHPDGSVEGVPTGRLWLSRGLSRAYRLLRSGKPYTYSCMVRAWRRTCLARCLPRREGHVGVTESLLLAQQHGFRVTEVAATLRGRSGGSSGLRLVPSVLEHVRLLEDATLGRLAEGAGR